jgi:parallel beta-helix repeat protein
LILFNSTSASSIIALTGASVSNKTIIIDGTFTVDQSMTFTGCTFLMQCNAIIAVNAGKTLTFNSCSLKAACTSMWNGIYASDPTAEIIMDDCNLYDAIDGIVLTNSAKGTLTHNSFDNNYNNIRINLNTIAGTCNISKNTFEFNGTLLPPYDGYRPAHGIKITNSTLVDIGSNGGNTFENLSNGVSVNEFQEIIGEGANLHLYIPPQSIVQLIDNQF